MAYSVKTLADRWDCSQRHIYKLIETGRLRSFSIGSSRKGTRISDEEVVRWESGGASATHKQQEGSSCAQDG